MYYRVIARVSIFVNIAILLLIAGKRVYFSHTGGTISQSAEFLNTMRNDAFADLPIDSSDIVLVGTSMTEGLFLHEMLHECRILNRGIGGNTSRHIAERVKQIAAGRPRMIFLEMGICDLFFHVPLDTFDQNFNETIRNIRELSPHTKILVQSIMPVGDPHKDLRGQLDKFNAYMKAACIQQGLVFIDLYAAFQVDSRLNPRYDMDGIHLNGRGYLIWSDKLHDYIEPPYCIPNKYFQL